MSRSSNYLFCSPGYRTRLAAVIGGAAVFAVLAASTAMAAHGDCSQPLSNGDGPAASDCAYILLAAVSLRECELCVCDVNSSGLTNAADALTCLKKAVGQNITIHCPSCDGSITTTTLGTNSTTSTSTTSSTTTIPVNCSGNGGCSSLPDTFRCNPFTGTCEEPCTRNNDCHDFYECNKTNGYCQEPPLTF